MKNYLNRAFSLTSILLLSLSPQCISAQEISPYNIRYTAIAKGFKLETQRNLEIHDNRYIIEQKSTATFASSTERSIFELTDDIIRPSSYEFERTVFGRSLKRTNTFNHEASTVSFQENDNKAVIIPLEKQETFDPINFHLQFRKNLEKNTESKHFSFDVIDEDKIREYEFNVIGQESLKTPLGYFNTIKLVRDRDSRKKKTTIWLAEDHEYIVLKIVHEKKGELNYEMDILEGTLDGVQIQGSQKPAEPRVPLRTP